MRAGRPDRMHRPRLGLPALALGLGLALILMAASAAANPADVEPPALAGKVAAKALPPVAQRLPAAPLVEPLARPWQSLGRQGGAITLLMGRARDVRLMYVYGYARLVGYTPDLEIRPDLLERVEVEDNRVFTLHLRPGHRWSDGHPFTSEDFRYWWEDMVQHPELPPFGPPAALLVDGTPPTVEILDARTVRYRWPRPNPYFLPALAGARPLIIYAPAHYLKQFHADHADPEALRRRVADHGQQGWPQLHNRLDNPYDNDNPELPTLQPWVNTTAAPAERFVFVRNPYYHRVDPEGRQLPYLDRIVMQIADPRIIPAKTGAGESDLQARYLRFDNYTFLKQGEARNNYTVHLWREGAGAHLALYPNLNARDPVWRALLRDARFRRALSLAIHREEINQVIYYGLALPPNNTVLPESPLWRPEYQTAWAEYRPDEADRLLDAIGLTRRNAEGIRLLPDGRPLEIIVETAGESTEEVDALELVADAWRRIGIKLFTKPSQLEVFRNRIYAGDALMAIAKGLENGLVHPDMPPVELAPVDQAKYQWPKWGQYHQTRGQAGERPDLPAARELMGLLDRWAEAKDEAGRAEIWHRMLSIHADQVFTIGLVSRTLQPVVVRNTLHNVPTQGLYNWDPGAHFGIYRPDTFWTEVPAR